MEDKESFRRRRLPHWDVPDAAYFVTTCLDGSIPAKGLIDLERFRREIQRRPQPENLDKREWQRHLAKLHFARLDWWLDRKPDARHLADPALAKIVVDAFYFFAGQRYDLLAFVVMPSHCHWVFQPLKDWGSTLRPTARLQSPRERIVRSINRFTAFECNKARQMTGVFWQRESYDHWVRDVDELERIILYVENNPVKAGLVQCAEDWAYSSAHDRKKAGLEFGVPLVRIS